MRDSNSRGVAPNTPSKSADPCPLQAIAVCHQGWRMLTVPCEHPRTPLNKTTNETTTQAVVEKPVIGVHPLRAAEFPSGAAEGCPAGSANCRPRPRGIASATMSLAGQRMLRWWPGVPRRVGAVGAARPARSAAGPGAAQRRRLFSVRLNSAMPIGPIWGDYVVTAPEAVDRYRQYLGRLRYKRLVGPRVVRRLPSVRFSGGFAGPCESVKGCLSGPYAGLAARGVHLQRHASTAVPKEMSPFGCESRSDHGQRARRAGRQRYWANSA
jgi:hypothetical protein